MRDSPRELKLKRDLGRRILQLRRELGVTVAGAERPLSYGALATALSAALGFDPAISSSTVQRWERGEGNVAPWVVIELARLARTTVKEFVYPPKISNDELAPEAEPEEELPADEGSGRRYKR